MLMFRGSLYMLKYSANRLSLSWLLVQCTCAKVMASMHAQRKTHVHMHHLKTCIILPAYWDSQLYNIKALLQTHKRVSWEGLTLCHKEKGEQWEDGLRGAGHLLLKPNRLANNNEVKVFPARMKDTSSLSARSTRLKWVYHLCANAAFTSVCHVDQLLHGLMLCLCSLQKGLSI